MIEEWRPIPGWEHYEITDLGRIRSHISGRVLNPAKDRDGYPVLTLVRPRRQVRVHQLVLEAFVGPRPEGMEIRHLDGDPRNPALANLRYGTHVENMEDQIRHGRHAKANRSQCPRGHQYDEANTYRLGNKRACRACNRVNVAAYKARKKAAA